MELCIQDDSFNAQHSFSQKNIQNVLIFFFCDILHYTNLRVFVVFILFVPYVKLTHNFQNCLFCKKPKNLNTILFYGLQRGFKNIKIKRCKAR